MRNPSTFQESPSNGSGFGKELASAVAAPAVPGEPAGFMADIEDLITATTSLTGEDLARAKAKLLERVAAAKASVAKMSGAVADRARLTASATDGFVRERPWQALGIAALVGVVAGVVLARSR